MRLKSFEEVWTTVSDDRRAAAQGTGVIQFTDVRQRAHLLQVGAQHADAVVALFLLELRAIYNQPC
jgi:hypothetical protein